MNLKGIAFAAGHIFWNFLVISWHPLRILFSQSNSFALFGQFSIFAKSYEAKWLTLPLVTWSVWLFAGGGGGALALPNSPCLKFRQEVSFSSEILAHLGHLGKIAIIFIFSGIH